MNPWSHRSIFLAIILRSKLRTSDFVPNVGVAEAREVAPWSCYQRLVTYNPKLKSLSVDFLASISRILGLFSIMFRKE